MLAVTSAHAVPTADETLAALFAKATRPQFVSAGEHACTVGEEEDGAPLSLAQFDGRTGEAHPIAHWTLAASELPADKTLEEIGAACGDDARRFISLALASCRNDDSFLKLLADPATLKLAKDPLPEALIRLPQAPVATGYFGALRAATRYGAGRPRAAVE